MELSYHGPAYKEGGINMQDLRDRASKHIIGNAMREVVSQRELFWQPQKRKLDRLPKPAREAIERGEALLRDAQRRKIESKVSFSLL
jgi:hypothetical protein